MSQSEMSSGAGLAISMSDILEAMKRIKDDVHYTPVMESSHFNSISGLSLYFKCENFQKTGSFKVKALSLQASWFELECMLNF